MKVVSGSEAEDRAIRSGSCHFAITEENGSSLYVSTTQEIPANLPFWGTLVDCGRDRMKRFAVGLSRDDLYEQLIRLFPDHEVVWVK